MINCLLLGYQLLAHSIVIISERITSGWRTAQAACMLRPTRQVCQSDRTLQFSLDGCEPLKLSFILLFLALCLLFLVFLLIFGWLSLVNHRHRVVHEASLSLLVLLWCQKSVFVVPKAG